ncbi:MAG: universal stress protein [Candidatus Sericytochromatia bacterium]
MSKSPGSVVVGVDGSRAAVAAAKWAVVEAVSREVPLRLVHVADVEPVSPSAALRDASAAIAQMGRAVTVETATLSGGADAALVEESLSAAILCVGSTGIGRMARMFLGSTAAALAERAHCPVAVIRDGIDLAPSDGWIAVPITDDFDNDAVVHLAMQEARLRGAPVVALGSQTRLSRWAQRYPDVRVRCVDAGSEVAGYLETTDEPIAFVVVGHGDIRDVPRIIGPHNRPGRSVLVVRQ